MFREVQGGLREVQGGSGRFREVKGGGSGSFMEVQGG